MTLLGGKLTVPKIVAIILAVFAFCYGALLVIVAGNSLDLSLMTGFLFGMLALASTPFFAISQLNRVTGKGESPPARPIVMALVMLAPTVFWFYWGLGSLVTLSYTQIGDFLLLLAFVLIPAILSLWLSMTFMALAIQGRTKDADIE